MACAHSKTENHTEQGRIEQKDHARRGREERRIDRLTLWQEPRRSREGAALCVRPTPIKVCAVLVKRNEAVVRKLSRAEHSPERLQIERVLSRRVCRSDGEHCQRPLGEEERKSVVNGDGRAGIVDRSRTPANTLHRQLIDRAARDGDQYRLTARKTVGRRCLNDDIAVAAKRALNSRRNVAHGDR